MRSVRIIVYLCSLVGTMSGHSKWHQIRFKKGLTDAKRGKVFTKHAALVALAAKGGGDPDKNPALRLAIDNAKSDNTPNDNIERAIKKGTGEDKSGGDIIEVTYEGYGPGGIAVIVNAVTDNKNRTAQSVRHTFSSHGGNLGESGSVGYMFDLKGRIKVVGSGNGDEDELAIIDSGAEDLEALGDDEYLVTTAANDLAAVREALKDAGFNIASAEREYVAKAINDVADKAMADKILKFMDVLEDDDDVSTVASNFDIPDEFME
jgi:YebC/PmpR family DNA-binding regulatory protein